MSGFEPYATALIGSVARDVLKSLFNLKKSKTLPEIIKDVDGCVGQLEAHVKDFQTHVSGNPRIVTTYAFQQWKTEVNNFVRGVANLKDKFKFLGHATNLKQKSNNFTRVKHPVGYLKYKSEMAYVYMLGQKLLERGSCWITDRNLILVEPLEERVIPEINVPEIKEYPTLRKPLEEALRSLRRDSVKVIAICGMLGVGKTTLLQSLNNHERVSNLFEIVIIVKFREEGNEENVRRKIGQRLMLDGCGGITKELIHKELMKRKFLLLLDDVTEELDLNQIGIPHDSVGSKIILTSRFTHVCRLMSNVMMIKVDKLSNDEAWKMFEQIVGNVVDKPGIRLTAKEVAEECDGLPLLIKAVATSFRSKTNARLWKDGLNDLRYIDTKMEIEGVNEMYEFLASCYDQLSKEETKNCFLYGALFPAGTKIYTEHLVESWTEEGFFDSLHQLETHQDKLNKGHAILDRLTKLSLLEKDANDSKMMYVWMHNCIQQFALYQSRKDPESKLLVKRGLKSGKTHKIEDWEEARRISMIDSRLDHLPESPNCSKLLTLLLQKSTKLETIPPSFFLNAGSLQLLNLHATRIQSLPSSVSNMTVMKALYLNGCSSLQNLPAEIGNLKCLEVLDIRGTKIIFIPQPIANLVKLKILRVSYYKDSESGVARDYQRNKNVISKLLALEELVIQVFSNQYNEWCNEVANVVNEVVVLNNLYSLKFCFPKADTFRTSIEAKGIWMGCVESFQLFVGCPDKGNPEILNYLNCRVDRYLRYCDGELKDNDIICDVIAKTQAVEVIEHKDITRLSDFRGVEAADLYGFLFEKCHKLESIVDAGVQDGDKLPIPQELYLSDLPRLRSVFEGEKQLASVSRLKVLELKKCPELTKVISDGMIEQLTGLQKLTIEECGQIEELIIQPKGTSLKALNTLRLLRLPKLSSICNDPSLTWPSLEVLEVDGCPLLKNLPFNEENAPRLRLIEGKKEWWTTLQNAEVKRQLARRCSIKF